MLDLSGEASMSNQGSYRFLATKFKGFQKPDSFRKFKKLPPWQEQNTVYIYIYIIYWIVIGYWQHDESSMDKWEEKPSFSESKETAQWESGMHYCQAIQEPPLFQGLWFTDVQALSRTAQDY